ncbi:MAG: hypothetical protein M3401_11910 [Actinomycetota bacterium]|nr:hypothetical protein [Actinomycetota bacterium]
MLRESSSPLTDDLRAQQTGRDLGVRYALGGEQDDLRALHIAMGQRQLRRTRLKLTPLVIRDSDVGRPAIPTKIRQPRYDSFQDRRELAAGST